MTRKKQYMMRRPFGFAARLMSEVKLILIEYCFHVVSLYVIFAFKMYRFIWKETIKNRGGQATCETLRFSKVIGTARRYEDILLFWSWFKRCRVTDGSLMDF